MAAQHPPRDPRLPRLALLHDPGCFRHLPPGTADLVLSGHLHGGQLGLFRVGGGWTVPRIAGLPDHGLWARGRERMYVHRGNAHYGFPLRIGVPAEETIMSLHFVPESPQAAADTPEQSGRRHFRYDETMVVPRPPDEVSAYLAAVERTPEWLAMCVRLVQVSPGPRGAGTKLHYVYRELGRERDMDGEIITWEPGRRLTFRYTDHMHVITLDFSMTPEGDGGSTRLHHTLFLESRHLLARILWPLFKLALLRSWPRNLVRLRKVLSS